MKKTINLLLTNVKFFVLAIMILTAFSGAAKADAINLNMQGSDATIPKGNTITRNIYNIPAGYPGTLRLKLKFHAVNVIPSYTKLKVEVRHGNSTLQTYNCYSLHAPGNMTPKCNSTISVSETEANKSGNWSLRVTNNGNFEVMGFDIEKGSDINPLVPNFKTTFTPDCPNTVNLDMEGTTLTLTKGGTQERKIFLIGSQPGVLRLKAKWHAVNIIPTYNALKIELLKPNGQVASSGNFYSIHSNKSPKFDITYNITASDAALAGNWKLRITNNSGFEVTGFNIEKENGEINPLVPNFFSSYKANCSF